MVTFLFPMTCGLWSDGPSRISWKCSSNVREVPPAWCLPADPVLAFPHDLLGRRVLALGAEYGHSVSGSLDCRAGSHWALQGASLGAHHPQGPEPSDFFSAASG